MRYLGLVMGFLMACSVHAKDQSIEISCDNNSVQAVMDVPRPADKFLRVVCTRFGNVLIPTASWFWTTPGAYNPSFFPAQMVQDSPEVVGNSIFFKSIQVNVLSEEKSQDKWSLLAGMFPPEESPKTALEIVAKNNAGNHHFIYIFPNSWGYSCSPTCQKENAFILINKDKLLPQW